MFHAKYEKIQMWKPGIQKILNVFNVLCDDSRFSARFHFRTLENHRRLSLDTSLAVAGIPTNVRHLVNISGSTEVSSHSAHPKRFQTEPGGADNVSTLSAYPRECILAFYIRQMGELQPRAPRKLFGRENIVEEILGLVQSDTPSGGGGSGKTPIALTVLHHEHAKRRLSNERRFLRCDEFPTSVVHFLN